MDKEKIIEKVKTKIPLTREEELFYLTVIGGFTKKEADTILAIAENKNPELLID